MRLFLIIFIIIIFLIPTITSANEDCLKEVYVQVIYKRSNPNPFVKVKEPERLGDKKTVTVSCDLYKTIEVGDLLKNKDEEVSRFRFGSNDGGVLEREYFKVLKK